jgi:predicted phosphohydrolase
MMKLQVMSDLHLEFGGFYPEKVGDVLLLAGDICVADYFLRNDAAARKHNSRANDFFTEFCGEFDQVYMVMGNHEHYGGDFTETRNILENVLADTNVIILENEGVQLTESYALWGSTFWTDFDRKNWFVTQASRRGMSDYHVIDVGNTSLGTDYIYEVNRVARYALEDALKASDKKFVIMTHHGLVAPPRGEMGPSFSNNNMDFNYFNTGLEEFLFLNEKVTHLVHGHTHDSYDYVREGTRVVVNPRGYYGHSLNDSFNPNFVMEV